MPEFIREIRAIGGKKFSRFSFKAERAHGVAEVERLMVGVTQSGEWLQKEGEVESIAVLVCLFSGKRGAGTGRVSWVSSELRAAMRLGVVRKGWDHRLFPWFVEGRSGRRGSSALPTEGLERVWNFQTLLSHAFVVAYTLKRLEGLENRSYIR